MKREMSLKFNEPGVQACRVTVYTWNYEILLYLKAQPVKGSKVNRLLAPFVNLVEVHIFYCNSVAYLHSALCQLGCIQGDISTHNRSSGLCKYESTRRCCTGTHWSLKEEDEGSFSLEFIKYSKSY